MNKTLWIQEKLPFTKKLLECSYCTGVYSGLIVYTLRFADLNDLSNSINLREALIWALASSAFCYIADSIAMKLESE